MRTELHLQGVDIGSLGSLRDKTLRGFLKKQKQIESYRLMVEAVTALRDTDKAQKYYQDYFNALWYLESSEESQGKMLQYYNDHIKELRPTMRAGEDGMPTVGGLT